MKKKDRFLRENVIAYFGSQTEAAQYFGISVQAVHKWDKGMLIPEKQRLKLMLDMPKRFPQF